MVTLFTIAKRWKQFKCPSVDAQIKKIWHIHNYHEIFKQPLNREEIMTEAITWMDLKTLH